MAVELEPAPNLSYKSSSQVARLQMIRGELSPDVLASRALDDDLMRSIEGSVAQASVMWLLHRGLAVVKDGESLEQQIVRFSTAVFDAIRTSYPMLRKAEQERLWLIYFKGLLIANTHPHEEMVSALRNIAYRSGFGGLPPLAKGPGETAKPIPGRASDDDAKALKQIARGLAENNSSFEM